MSKDKTIFLVKVRLSKDRLVLETMSLPLSLRVAINLLRMKTALFCFLFLQSHPCFLGLGRTHSTTSAIHQLEIKPQTPKDATYTSTPSHEEFSVPGILIVDERMSQNPITMRICNWKSLGSQSSYKRICACIQFRAIYYI